MQNRNTRQEKMTTYFENVTVTFNSYVGIKNRDMTKPDKFYKIYSPKKFKLRPRGDIYLELEFNIQMPDRIEPWLNLLPSLKSTGLKIENDDWKDNLTKDNTIQLHILNTSFFYAIDIKKN